MNKGDLVNKISESAGITKTQAQKALKTFIGSSNDALKKGERITLIGFGTFSVNERAARKGRNPKTGAEIKIPKKRIVKFKPGKDLVGNLK